MEGPTSESRKIIQTIVI